MDKNDLLKNIYDDFFGVESIDEKNKRLKKEIIEPLPIKIEVKRKKDDVVKKEDEEKEVVVADEKMEEADTPKEDKDNNMATWFSIIDGLYLDEDSKALIKKIIEYMRKYNEGVETSYIPFNLQIISKNEEVTDKVVEVISKASVYFKYTIGKRIIIKSMYNLDSNELADPLYDANNCLIELINLEGFENLETKNKTKYLYSLEENIKDENKKKITVLVARSEEQIKEFFTEKENMIEQFFSFKIKSSNPEVQDVYREVLDKVENEIKGNEEKQVKLLDYISTTYPQTTLDFPSYRDNIINSIVFNKDIPSYEKPKTLEETFAELNQLVGLEKVKKVLYELSDLIELKNKAKDKLKIKNVNLHMVFLGNPGTGKTTVARIVSSILYNLKYIRQDKLIEVSSKDLVGEYVGQTAPKTMAVVERALGGVLFVDEAYSLASGGQQENSAYNEEAIATLIQAMENYRDDLVVIFAGYTKEMQDFLNANSGIVSRIGYTLEFEDYTTDQLIEIFKGYTKKAGFVLTDGAIEKLRGVIDEYRGTPNFGNARFVRSVYEKSVIKHASNTKGKKRKDIIRTMTEDDISVENLLKM